MLFVVHVCYVKNSALYVAYVKVDIRDTFELISCVMFKEFKLLYALNLISHHRSFINGLGVEFQNFYQIVGFVWKKLPKIRGSLETSSDLKTNYFLKS